MLLIFKHINPFQARKVYAEMAAKFDCTYIEVKQ